MWLLAFFRAIESQKCKTIKKFFSFVFKIKLFREQTGFLGYKTSLLEYKQTFKGTKTNLLGYKSLSEVVTTRQDPQKVEKELRKRKQRKGREWESRQVNPHSFSHIQ